MMKAHIALVTDSTCPELSASDKLLSNHLNTHGYRAGAAVWDDKSTDWHAYDLVLVRSCWNYHFKREKFKQWLNTQKKQSIPMWNPPELLLWNMEKTYLKELVRKGVATIDTAWYKKGDPIDFDKLLSEKNWREAVVKPTVSASAYNTLRINPQTLTQQRATINRMTAQYDFMVQEFRQEVCETGELSFIFIDTTFSHCIQKQPQPGEFRVSGRYNPHHCLATPDPGLIQQIHFILQHIPGEWLYARVDGVSVDGNFLLMELELIEPHLFFAYSEQSVERFTTALASRLPSKPAEKIPVLTTATAIAKDCNHLPTGPLLTEYKALCSLAERIAENVPAARTALNKWRQRAKQNVAADKLEDFSAEVVLDDITQDLRKTWLGVAHGLATEFYRSPFRAQLIHAPQGETFIFDYERSSQIDLFNNRLNHYRAITLDHWKADHILFSSFQSGLSTLLLSLVNLYTSEGDEILRIASWKSYIESRNLLDFLRSSSVTYKCIDDLATLTQVILDRHQHIDLLLLEPVVYNNQLSVLDIDQILEAYLQVDSDRSSILLLDTTLIGDTLPIQYILQKLGQLQNPPFVMQLSSALKLDQQGLELSNVGLLSVYSHKSREGLMDALGMGNFFRSHHTLMGVALPVTSLFALDLPWVFNPEDYTSYCQNVFSANRQMAKQLQSILGDKVVIHHPSLSKRNDLPWAKAPMVLLELKDNQPQTHNELLDRLQTQITQRKLCIDIGTSYGFRKTRLEIRQLDRNHPSVLKVAVGSRQTPSDSGLIELLVDIKDFFARRIDIDTKVAPTSPDNNTLPAPWLNSRSDFFSHNFLLENSRVRLEPITTENIYHLADIACDARIWEHLPEAITTSADFMHYADRFLRYREQQLYYSFVIYDKHIHRAVGLVTLSNMDFYNRTLEIGPLWFGTDFQGSGVYKASYFSLLSFCFETFSIGRVEITVYVGNIRSQRAKKKIGAVREGIARERWLKASGERVDAVVYSFVTSEWPQIKKTFFAEFINTEFPDAVQIT